MVKLNWRLCFTAGFPKYFELAGVFEEELKAKFPKVLKHLERHSIVISGSLTGYFFSFGLGIGNHGVSLEIAARLFEIFLLDGEQALGKILLRMIELKMSEVMARTDTDLQSYILREIIIECIEDYPMATLVNNSGE